MKQKNILASLLVASSLPLQAASDLTNPLNTYSGSSQDNGNGAGQPAFLTDAPASGLEVSKLAPGFLPTVAFETIFFNNAGAVSPEFPGAKFGGNRGGNDGSNYLRTVETDYNMKDFTAFVTVRRPVPTSGTNRRSVFFGMGAGARNANNGPDQSTSNASVYLELQNSFGNASRRLLGDPIPPAITNQNQEFNWEPLTTVSDNSMRIRMTYNSVASTVQYAIDFGYDGVTFVPDQVIDEENDSALNTPVAKQAKEWAAGDRASIYFGGDRSVVFTDLVVTVTAPPTPPTPTGLTLAGLASGQVNLQWTTPVAIPGTTYSVYRSTTTGVFTAPAIVTGLTTTSYSDISVVNGIIYYYRVTQSNTVAVVAESPPSNEISAAPVSGAVTPSGFIAVNGGKNALVVDWANLLSPFDTYTVRRATTVGGPFTVPPGGSGLTESRFLDTSVVDGTTYFYTVTSVLGGDESPQTSPVSATSRALEVFVDFNASGAPPTPTFSGSGAAAPSPLGTSWNGIAALGLIPNLTDSTSNLSSVGLNATGQGIFSKTNGLNVGGDNTTPGSGTLTALGGFDLMQDYVFQNNASTVTYTLTGLVPDRKYDLYLYGYGDVLGQNTLFGVNGVSRQTSSPAGLTTLTEGRHYVTFTGVAAVDGTLAFTWRNGFGPTDADANSSSGLINGFQLVENASAVLQPVSLAATDGLSGVTLTWSEVEATNYKIFRSTTRASGYTLVGSSGGDSSFVDTTGTPGITYYYVVKGVNVVGESTFESFFSGEVSGLKISPDADLDGLSDANEALLGTDPNNSSDFFKAQSSTVTPNGANYNVSFTLRGAPGTYVIERSTTLDAGSWTAIPSSSQTFTWNTGTVLTNPLTLSVTDVAPAPGGKEFFRAKGVVP